MSVELSSHKEYLQWFGDIKSRILVSQQRAVMKVNQEMLSLYWNIGEALAIKETVWGDKFIERLAKDLKQEFPDTTGYSLSNLKYMKRWYSFYNQDVTISQQAVDQLRLSPDFTIGQQITNSQQAVDQLQELLFCIPWGHHTYILTKVKDVHEAIFYIAKTIQNNWSRSILSLQIESKLYERQGKAITNFTLSLPAPQSDLAQSLLKSSYNLEHLTLAENVREVDLEKALVTHIVAFLTELGTGFAFMGRQVPLIIEGDEFFIDLLFFNTELNCHVVVELKIGDFKADYAGQLNLYVAGVNAQYKREHHAETIGILLCKTPNKTVVEYSIRNINAPVGVAEYTFKHIVPEEFMASLPTVEQLEQELNKDIESEPSPLEKKLAHVKSIIAASNKETVQIKKDKAATEIIAKQVFIPLYDHIQALHAKNGINGMFDEIKFELVAEHTSLTTVEEFLDRVNSLQSIDALKLEIRYNGFKQNGTDLFNCYESIIITLEDYRYVLTDWTSQPFRVEKLYHQDLTAAEIDEIAQNILSGLIDRIAGYLQRT